MVRVHREHLVGVEVDKLALGVLHLGVRTAGVRFSRDGGWVLAVTNLPDSWVGVEVEVLLSPHPSARVLPPDLLALLPGDSGLSVKGAV